MGTDTVYLEARRRFVASPPCEPLVTERHLQKQICNNSHQLPGHLIHHDDVEPSHFLFLRLLQ